MNWDAWLERHGAWIVGGLIVAMWAVVVMAGVKGVMAK